MTLSPFAVNLRLYRQLRRLSQRELAMRSVPALHQGYVSRLERGLQPSDESHCAVLATALGVSLEDIMRRRKFMATNRNVT